MPYLCSAYYLYAPWASNDDTIVSFRLPEAKLGDKMEGLANIHGDIRPEANLRDRMGDPDDDEKALRHILQSEVETSAYASGPLLDRDAPRRRDPVITGIIDWSLAETRAFGIELEFLHTSSGNMNSRNWSDHTCHETTDEEFWAEFWE
ncbi:uncharacterized protein BCR38DRAFT_411915 [Pseudomassariella vexata]|uniref:Uncharacterized protein n=1 Tax=Pseudomassariella vexata TaxID=1141098 RepID=A0A1Y2DNC7_9PEZI|nr:uncharacterized protein BCR38DRAFT_411915 [Pseudomassariella vexata]ORY60798.1 hypothetical protein BCR38DRAFT_411915 [Pseudomassariella vexata]